MRPALTSSGTTALILLALCALPGGAQTAKPAAAVRTPAEVLFLANAAAGPVAKDRGQLLGYVSDAAGLPQPGAVVEVRPEGLRKAPLRELTTAEGLFRLSGLAPGTYYVQVGKGQRIAARQRVEIHASERALLLVSLPALLEGMQLGPPPGVSPDAAFTWALRQSTLWRPILHMDGSDGLAEPGSEQPVEGMVALTAGAGDTAFSSSDVATTFRLKTRAFGSQLGLSGEIGTNGGIGGTNTQVAAQLSPNDPASAARLQVTVRQISVDGIGAALPPLREFSLNYANAVSLGDSLRIQYGSMFNAVSMTDTVAAFDPYLRALMRVGAEGELEFRAVEGVPPLHFTGDYASLDDPTPQVTLDHGHARLERARHQELRYSESLTPADTVSVAVFDDHYQRAAVNGSYSVSGAVASQPELDAQAGLLPDLLNNMFLANGGDYAGWGYRFTLNHRLSDNWQAALGFSDGAVLAPQGGSFSGSLASALAPARADAITVKLTGVMPVTHTQLICSYRALSRLAATGLDLYDDTAAEANSYANVFLRQPLPGLMGANGRLAALVEIHNLLAQGYIPMLGSDGRTLYLVQSARSLRGGLTFSF
jgi:hypothetical protein